MEMSRKVLQKRRAFCPPFLCSRIFAFPIAKGREMWYNIQDIMLGGYSMKYLIAFLVSMVPIIELRGGVPIAMGLGIPAIPAIILCAVGNILPVPFIYFFARKFLLWGARQRFIGKICSFFVVKGEKAGQKMVAKTGRGGLFLALMLFVGVPLPGTGAWTGTLGASFLNMGFKSAVVSVSLGVIIAGIIMATVSALGLHILGF